MPRTPQVCPGDSAALEVSCPKGAIITAHQQPQGTGRVPTASTKLPSDIAGAKAKQTPTEGEQGPSALSLHPLDIPRPLPRTDPVPPALLMGWDLTAGTPQPRGWELGQQSPDLLPCKGWRSLPTLKVSF